MFSFGFKKITMYARSFPADIDKVKDQRILEREKEKARERERERGRDREREREREGERRRGERTGG